MRVCPVLRERNSIAFRGRQNPLASIWIGDKDSHLRRKNDLPLNIACVAAGAPAFTLISSRPGTQNLLSWPIELTPAGRPIKSC